MRTTTSLGLVLGILLAAPTSRPARAQVEPKAQAAYARLLEAHVEDGLVDYAALAEDPDLNTYVEALAKAEVPEGRDARIAFYIDAYNALVLHAVITSGRPRSVLDVDGFFDAETHTVAGRALTLDALEKKVLNPFARDPRTHFVLVCGAVGCPLLEPKPYTGSDVSQRMEKATRRYLQSPRGARVADGKLSLSKIFDWYAGDFGGKDKVRTFVESRLTASQRARLGDSYTLDFIDYDWTLNQQ